MIPTRSDRLGPGAQGVLAERLGVGRDAPAGAVLHRHQFRPLYVGHIRVYRHGTESSDSDRLLTMPEAYTSLRNSGRPLQTDAGASRRFSGVTERLSSRQKTAREVTAAGIRAAEQAASYPPDEASLRAAREILELGVGGLEQRQVEQTAGLIEATCASSPTATPHAEDPTRAHRSPVHRPGGSRRGAAVRRSVTERSRFGRRTRAR